MESANCLRCGHPFDSHSLEGDRECKRKKLVGWDEGAKMFTGEEVCECPGYVGRIPIGSSEHGRHGCPHELLPGSRVCVACKEPVPVKAKR
jgi:hypothetical protein